MKDFDEISSETRLEARKCRKATGKYSILDAPAPSFEVGSVSFPAQTGSNSGVWGWERVRMKDFDEISSETMLEARKCRKTR